MAGGVQHGQAAWIAGRHEPRAISTAMGPSNFESTTENPKRMSGPEILGLPALFISIFMGLYLLSGLYVTTQPLWLVALLSLGRYPGVQRKLRFLSHSV